MPTNTTLVYNSMRAALPGKEMLKVNSLIDSTG